MQPVMSAAPEPVFFSSTNSSSECAVVPVENSLMTTRETVNELPLVAVPAGVVTLIVPLVAPAGADVVICVSLSTTNAAVAPLNLTLVVPVKPWPVSTTDFPRTALVGAIEETPSSVKSCGVWTLTRLFQTVT